MTGSHVRWRVLGTPASSVRWRILWLMVIGALVAYVLRLSMSIAGEAMIRDLSLTPVQLGLILSAFAWGYAIFQVPGGLMTSQLLRFTAMRHRRRSRGW